MQTLDDVFSAFGGPSKVGQAVGVSTEHAASMRRRRSIPVKYWPSLVRAARDLELDWITFEALTSLHAEPSCQSGTAA